MKHLSILLCLSLLIMPNHVKAEESSKEACAYLLDENNQPINQEAYQKCLEENHSTYGLEWPDPYK